MKNFLLGLILMLFAFGTSPVQAHASDEVKTEITKSDGFDVVQVLEVSLEVPQILFTNPNKQAVVELRNCSLEKANFTQKLISKEKARENFDLSIQKRNVPDDIDKSCNSIIL